MCMYLCVLNRPTIYLLGSSKRGVGAFKGHRKRPLTFLKIRPVHLPILVSE